MMTNIVSRGLACVLFVLTTSAAWSAQLTYTFSGNANGSVAGTSFTGQNFTFTVTGDSSAVQFTSTPSDLYSNILTGGTISIAGTACASGCTFTTPAAYIVYNLEDGIHGISTLGNAEVAGQTLIEACYFCGGTPVNDNLSTPVPPTVSGADGEDAPYLAFPTSGGSVAISAITGQLTYAVQLTAVSVPTLSNWGTLLLLFGLAASGYYMQRRRLF